MTDARYYLPVTLDQLQHLQSVLDTVSSREANPDAEVFQLLEVVRKTRADAAKSSQKAQEHADILGADPIDPVLSKVRWLRDELRAMGFASEYTIRAPGSARAPVVYLFAGMTDSDVDQANADRRPGY
ncbi:hypothetical protein D3C81_1403210 [compost metagenome]